MANINRELISEQDVLEHVKAVWEQMQGNSPIYDFLFEDQSLVFSAASKGSVRARLTLSKRHLNSRGVLHGSVSGTIVDFFGGLAIATYGREKTGASVDIHVSYLGTAGINDDIEIEGIANKVGSNLAFTTVTIYKITNGERGSPIITASHTKFVRQ